jgi:hypothetical protein
MKIHITQICDRALFNFGHWGWGDYQNNPLCMHVDENMYFEKKRRKKKHVTFAMTTGFNVSK